MVAQGSYRHFAKRSEPIAEPTAPGISGAAIASSTILPTNGLAIDNDGTPGPPPAALPYTVSVYESATATALSSTQSATATGAVSSGSSKSISLGTVIGSCVGAFIVITALIILGVWFYRRYLDSLKKQAKARLQDDKERRRPWKKLENGEDKWEGMHQTKEVDQVVPMEKLTMFKRGASVRTAYTQKSIDEPPLTYPQSFAPFDTNLVRTLSADNAAIFQSQPSQDANSVKGQSPNNLSSNSLGGPLSPSLNMAIPTPEATVLQPHKWESAEVVHYTEGQSTETLNSTDHDKDARSTQNPFFGSQGYTRTRSNSTSNAKSPNLKGKERMRDSMVSSDPFDALDAQLPQPIFAHQVTGSSASSQSRDRALKALMGALELSEEEVRERLRVASMQPSVISQLSQYSAINEEDFTKNFLLPTLSGKRSSPS